MPVTEIKSYDQFKEVIASDKPTFLKAQAVWCAPCKLVAPIYKKLAEETGDKANFYEFDVDEQSQISEEVGIRAMPTFLLFKNGEKVKDLTGAAPPALQSFIREGSQ